MAVVHLFHGEKDGQKFAAPWPRGEHPDVFYAIPASGDEELMALGSEAPPGLKEELSVLAYKYRERVRGELRYYRAYELDRSPQKSSGTNESQA